MTYASSATNGDSITINEPGMYWFRYVDFNSTGSHIVGISKNSNQLTTSIASITASHILAIGYAQYDNVNAVADGMARLAAGDVLRAHGDNAGDGTTYTMFSVTRVAP
jgi:hypothetical protein